MSNRTEFKRLKKERKLKLNTLFSQIPVDQSLVQKATERAIKKGLRLCQLQGYSDCKFKAIKTINGLHDKWGRMTKKDSETKTTLLFRKVRVSVTILAQ